MTEHEQAALYAVAAYAIRHHAPGTPPEQGRIVVRAWLDWAAKILEVELDDDVAFSIAENAWRPHPLSSHTLWLDKFLSHARRLEIQADGADGVLLAYVEHFRTLIGTSITNDNGVQVTVVISKNLWDSIVDLAQID